MLFVSAAPVAPAAPVLPSARAYRQRTARRAGAGAGAGAVPPRGANAARMRSKRECSRPGAEPPAMHRRTSAWACVKHCGACCYLQPEERPAELAEWLSPQQLERYYSLVGPDGWCRHFDHEQRTCGIFEERPDFCRATPSTFAQLYGVARAEFDAFARTCCADQIHEVYGPQSDEMRRFVDALAAVDPALRPELEALLRDLQRGARQ